MDFKNQDYTTSISDVDNDIEQRSEDKIVEENNLYTINESKKKSKGGVIVFSIIVFILIFCSGVIWYFGYTSYDNKFISGTKLNGIDVSNKNVSEASQIIRDSIQDKTLRVINPDKSKFSLSFEELGGELDPSSEIRSKLDNQNRYLWFLPTDRNFKLKTKYEFDSGSVKDEVAKQIKNHIPSIDFTKALAFDKSTKKFVQNTDINNKVYSQNLLIDTVYTSLQDNNEYLDLTTLGTVSKDLKNLVRSANKSLNTSIKIKYGKKEIKISNDLIVDWISTSKDGIDINQRKLAEYLKQLSESNKNDRNGYHYTYDTSLLTQQIAYDIKNGHHKQYIALEMREKDIKLTKDKKYPYCTSQWNTDGSIIVKDTQALCVYENKKIVYGGKVVTGDSKMSLETPNVKGNIADIIRNKNISNRVIFANSKDNKSTKVSFIFRLQNGLSMYSLDKNVNKDIWANNAYLNGNGGNQNVILGIDESNWLFNNIDLANPVTVIDSQN